MESGGREYVYGDVGADVCLCWGFVKGGGREGGQVWDRGRLVKTSGEAPGERGLLAHLNLTLSTTT